MKKPTEKDKELYKKQLEKERKKNPKTAFIMVDDNDWLREAGKIIRKQRKLEEAEKQKKNDKDKGSG